MTPEEKTALARFLDLACDYLTDGHRRNLEEYIFEDAPVESGPSSGVFSSLPLAYQVDENEMENPREHDEDSRDNADSLEATAVDIAACKACGLAVARKTTVPGEGVACPLVMVIGEGPGADEDAAGRPFVGKAGQLLDKMLESIGLFRNKNCYIANMVKCRPPGNRDPGSEEIAACFPYLKRQITILRPQIILCVGRVAAQNLLGTGQGISALRGVFAEFRIEEIPIPVLPTFHPSAILRDETLKRPAWEDLKLLRSKLDSLNGG